MNRRIRPTLVVSAAVVVALAGISTADAAKSSASKTSTKQRVPSNTANSNEIRLSASAGNETTGKMKSVYRERNQGATIRQVFKGQVEAFSAGAELSVSVNGMQVATLIVGPLGAGEFEFSSVDDNPGDELPLPSGFPRLRAGDTVTIGNLTATYR